MPAIRKKSHLHLARMKAMRDVFPKKKKVIPPELTRTDNSSDLV